MREYHKIQTLFKRDNQTHRIIEGDWTYPEFEYLANNPWAFTEKVDGTNIRIFYGIETENTDAVIKFGGRTIEASVPATLYDILSVMFTKEKLQQCFHFQEEVFEIILYGEGYGARIQKGGGNYLSSRQDFVLFDVQINGLFLDRKNVEDVAIKLGIDVVPIIGSGTLYEAVDSVRNGFKSRWGDFYAEGLVVRPTVELRTRRNERIIAKIKHRDFKA